MVLKIFAQHTSISVALVAMLGLLTMGGRLLAEEAQKEAKQKSLAKLAGVMLGENGGDRLFYFPTRDEPYTPKKYGYKYEDVYFKSADGTQLHGWFMPSLLGVKKAKATIVFSHGNTGSLGHHLGFVDWLMKANYNVLLYDYRGFGKSKGGLTRRGVVEDVQAALAYVSKRSDVDATKLVSFSHSLGGAKSVTAIGMKPVKGLRAVIVHGGFASYKDMAYDKAGKLGSSLINDEFAAIDYVDKIAPVPLLVIHGENDRMVPLAQGLKLYNKAKEPKTLYKVPNGSHTDSLHRNGSQYRKKMLAWLEGVLN